MQEPKTVTVRYKRLETTGPYCNVEAGVEITFSTPAAEPISEQFSDAIAEHMHAARNTVDDEIRKEVTAAMARRDEEEEVDDEEDVSCEATCRICGCTDSHACHGGCYWVDDPEEKGHLCSQCLQQHYGEVAAKRLAAHPNRAFPLTQRVKGEMETAREPKQPTEF